MKARSVSPRAERALLAVAVGAAVTAYLLAYLVPLRGTTWIPVLAVTSLLPSIWIQWTRLPARLVRTLSRAVVALVATAALLVVLSRQVLLPVVRLDWAHMGEFVVGGMLSVAAAVFLYGGSHWRVTSGLVPAIAGILVAGGINPKALGFLPLAALAGAALWTHATLTGGPRRLGPALGLFVLAGAGLAVATIRFLPWAQPRVTRFVGQAYSEGKTGLSDRSELGEVERLAPSRRVVARVWTERPQLLRMQVFTHFDGRRWSVGRQEQRALAPLVPAQIDVAPLGPLLREIPGNVFAVTTPPSGGGLVETKILPSLSFDDGWGLLMPAGALLLAWPGESLKIDDLGRVTADGSAARLYGVANGEQVGLEPTAADLAPPAQLDPRVLRLAEELRLGARSDRQILGRTMEHLRSAYRYTLDVGEFQGKEPLATFLFEKKAGYCEYFATAAVVLLRMQGVPARYVKGVAVRSESKIAGHHLVRESDAHAWVEAYLGDEGWVEEDPTPANGYELTHATTPPGLLAERWEALAAYWSEAMARFQQGTLPRITSSIAGAVRQAWGVATQRPFALAGIAAAVIVFGLGVRLLRQRRWKRPVASPVPAHESVSADLKAALGRVEKHWARCGRPRPPSLGLREHLDAIPDGTLSPTARETSARVVEAYYGTSFGGRASSVEELSELRRTTKAL